MNVCMHVCMYRNMYVCTVCMHVFWLLYFNKYAVFATIAIWWGRGGYGYIWVGWRMGENTSVCLLTSVSKKKLETFFRSLYSGIQLYGRRALCVSAGLGDLGGCGMVGGIG